MIGNTKVITAGAKHRQAVLLRDQVEENFRFASAASIAGIFNTIVAIVTLWSPALHLPLMIWGGAIITGSLVRMKVMRRKKPAGNTEPFYRQQRTLIEGIAFYNGLCWAVGVALMAGVANNTEYLLVIILCSGMMGASVTTYTSMARAGMFFVIPLGLGGLVSLWAQASAPSISGTFLLAGYMFLLVRGGYARQARFNARILTREKLRESGETVKLLLNDFESQSSDWLWQVDENGCIREITDRFAEVSGRNALLLEGFPLAELFDEGSERQMLLEHLERGHGFRNHTIKLTISGSPHWWTLSAQPAETGGMRGVASDVTAQRRAEDRVSYMAHYDGLTDLANRFQFNDALQRAIKRAKPDEQVAVLCLDLDSFKSVNDTLGHPVGDQLLCEIARRIEDCVSSEHLVARLGGDEFAVLVPGANAQERALHTADQIIESISQPCQIDAAHVVTSTSIGIAITDGSDTDPTTLMTRADLALYAAKANGRNRYAVFEPGMDEAAQTRRALEMDMRAALVNSEFELHYQPLVNIRSGETVAYEALLRWNHPERGVVMPDNFIGIAEETGLIVQLGEWVIRMATSEVAMWPDHIRVSVNLSPVQMRSANLISTVFNAIAAAGIEPARLELEITENVLLHDSEVNIATLHKLRDFGVRISLDDFGTGYSSLNYLRSFPFDKIKIDRCFVSGLADNPDCQAIIRAVTGLATSLGMETTAEGVELANQLDHLRDEGCTEAQGYLFSRAQHPDEFTDLRSKRGIAATIPATPVTPITSDDVWHGTQSSADSDEAKPAIHKRGSS